MQNMRLINRFRFTLERLMLKGLRFHLIFIAALIGMVSLIGGVIVYYATAEFDTILKAVWWAFLRLTDPGYLGDDNGAVLRTVSTILTILGYVLFMGALIAILTQALHFKIRNLEKGFSPIYIKNHILILGWTSRTKLIVRELLLSEGRVKRFLKRIGAGSLRIVILAEEVDSTMYEELKAELGELWNSRNIILRSGSHLKVENIEKVRGEQAAVIIIPGDTFLSEYSVTFDSRTIKAVFTLTNYFDDIPEFSNHPPLVAEIFNDKFVNIAKSGYPGLCEMITSDAIICRLLAQNLRHEGLSHVYTDLLSNEDGASFYLKDNHDLGGIEFSRLIKMFPKAVLLGVVRHESGKDIPLLNPDHDFIVREQDKLVLVAAKMTDTFYEGDPPDEMPDYAPVNIKKPDTPERRILIFGWSRKIPELLAELETYRNEKFTVTVFSLFSINKRDELIKRHLGRVSRIEVTQHYGDYTAVFDMEAVEPERYDNILFLSNDWLEDTDESDARTELGYLLLNDLLKNKERRPEILIELLDSDNEESFEKTDSEVIISQSLISHILAQVSLRKELNALFNDLFTTGGSELYFVNPEKYDISSGQYTFDELHTKIYIAGEILIGYSTESKSGIKCKLLPGFSTEIELTESNKLIVLS